MSELVSYKQSDLISNVSNLRDDQKELIAYTLGRDWTMPTFKAKHFVGNAQITPYAKMKQYLLEINSRESAIENFEYECKKLQASIALEQEELDTTASPAQKKLHEIEIEHLGRLLKKNLHKAKDAYLERQTFLDLIDEMNNSSEGRLPNGDLLFEALKDPAKEEQLEREYWTLRLAKQTALDMIAYGRAGVGNIEAVAMLGEDQQEEVMKLACDYFVRNEIRTQNLLTQANEHVRLGVAPEKLTQQLTFKQEEADVRTVQNG